MPEKNQNISSESLRHSIEGLKQKYNLNGVADPENPYLNLVDIITFCNDSRYLNLPASNFNLWKSQRVLLKSFYMGTSGNENIFFTDDEWEWLENEANVFPEDHKRTIQKIKDRQKSSLRFSELTLVLGRRSGKTIIASVISCYEMYKLLSVQGGDPYKFYNIPYGQEIAVLNVATSFKQAQRLYSQIKARLSHSPFFQHRIAAGSKEEIRLFTNHDFELMNDPNQKLKNNGSVVIVCGHSDPDTLRGYAAICIIFDELGFYDEKNIVSGTRFYDVLQPSVAQFAEYNEGILVEISSPGPKSGILHKLYEESVDERQKHKLAFRAPTWVFSEDISEDNEVLMSAKSKDPDVYNVEYGAQWPSGTLFGKYFPEELVYRSIADDIGPEEIPYQGGEYFIHIDPAQSGNRYALVVVRKTSYREKDGKLSPRIILSFTKVWESKSGEGLDYLSLDREILGICKKYHPVVVSYDTWNSITSTQFLRRHGLMCVQTTFNRGYKAKIYQNLKELMSKPDHGLFMYQEPLLVDELINLGYKPTARGVSIGANPKSDCPTDDLSDCLAGASFMACGNYYKKLPEMITVYTGLR